MSDDTLDLGPCCSCGSTASVHTIVTLPYRAPVPGAGWGCAVCDLPSDGAVAVICDACDGASPAQACVGYPALGVRVPVATLTQPFDHDPARHPEEAAAQAADEPLFQLDITGLRWFLDSPPAGDPACRCSHCGQPIPAGEQPVRMWRTRGPETLEARFHDGCLAERGLTAHRAYKELA